MNFFLFPIAMLILTLNFNIRENFCLAAAQPLNGGVEEIVELPDDFYGVWSISGRLLNTDNPYLFEPNKHDIWLFQKNAENITLSNPLSGASAIINITEVKDNTAVFYREKITPNTREYERVRLTVSGNTLSGTDRIIFERYLGGYLLRKSSADYEFNGVRVKLNQDKNVFENMLNKR